MNNLNKINLPLEQRTRDEAATQDLQWNKGFFNFLLQRTENHYNRKKTEKRRNQLETLTNKSLPMLNDKLLLSLYKYACLKYQRYCNDRYAYTGFQTTSHERLFLKTLQEIISSDSTFKYLEVYPSSNHSKDLTTLNKMVVGYHVPDFIVFGLKHKGSSSLAIEVDGSSHVEKYSKDFRYYSHLKELGIFCWSIPNDKVSDVEFVTKALKAFSRQRSGALDQQIKRNKREIWCKTISSHLMLDEIEEFVYRTKQLQLNLVIEVKSIVGFQDCPRNIKTEIKLNNFLNGTGTGSRACQTFPYTLRKTC